MNEIKTIKIHCLSAALSPMTHMMGTSGNEAIINRTRIVSGGQVREVPALSGNAIRHSMVRAPGAMHITKTCGLYGKLNIDQANFLFYGGSLTDSSTTDNLSKIAAMQELMPLYRLLGGSLKNQVLAGSLLVSMGMLVCDENREFLEKELPPELIAGMPELRPCEDFVSGWQYTRGDARKRPELVDASDMPEEKSNLMIYGGQHVMPGALFCHSFILQNVSRLEVGALAKAVSDWMAQGGSMGGSSRIGHGKLHIGIYADAHDFFGGEVDFGQCAEMYAEHTEKNAQAIAEWLSEAFPSGRPAKEAKKGRQAKGDEIDYFAEVQEAMDI